MPDLLENLNAEQLQAVTHQSGPLLIVAGAGTGKTTVITRRIAWLIQQKLAKPEEILALTFTEKAASEMEERVDLLMPLGYVDFWISTFHAFCERILKQHALEVGLSNDFKLLDDTQQWILIHKNLDKFKLEYYKPLGNPSKFIGALLQHISRCKDELITPEVYKAYADTLATQELAAQLLPDTESGTEELRIRELAEAFRVYQQLLLDNDYLDFGDLINYTLHLFQQRPAVLEHYRQKFSHILVDEFQDTNYAQYELVRLLAQPPKEVKSQKSIMSVRSDSGVKTLDVQRLTNLTVVGDDDQSIYKFRGASVSNILKFKDDFPELTQVTLTQNYRSVQSILDLSYKLIQNNNPERLEVKLGISKRLINPVDSEQTAVVRDSEGSTDPRRVSSGQIQVLEGRDLSDELDLVVKKILQLKKEAPETSWNDFCILIRSRGASGEILPRLEAAGIPFTYLANTGLYRKPLIADLIGYLKLLDNYHDSASVFRTLNFPHFQLPVQDVAHITQYARKHTLSVYEVLRKVQDAPETEGLEKIEAKSRVTITELLGLIHAHTEHTKIMSAVEVFVHVIKDLHVVDFLEEETLENVQNRELLEQFYKKVEAFEQDKVTSDKSLKAFLFDLELELRAGHDGDIKFDPNQGPESVKVLTVHASKGLEFQNVFIVNLVDQRFPTREKSSGIEIPEELVKDILPEGDFHLQEERRLFYVAITRAKTRVYFSWAKDYGGSRAKKPSIFLQELDLVPSDKVNKATGKVVFTKPDGHPRREVYQQLPARFSYSAINTFLRCPLEYKYAHYLKLPLPGAAPLSFGITIHGTLQKYLEEYQRSVVAAQMDLFDGKAKVSLPSLERLMELYAMEWVDEWYESKADKEKNRETGVVTLQNFYRYSIQHMPKPKFVEKAFNLPVGDFVFTGKIDRVDVAPEGLVIIDYKTGTPKKKKGGEDVDQLRIYQWACEEQFGEKVASMSYWYLKSADFKPDPVAVATPDVLLDLQERLLKTIHEIRDAVRYDRFAELHQKAKQHTCGFADFA
ncbi:MAG: UvrD-helicase domain-containing protein [Candidatus Doudnabacteria bacterium]|nr:UvrD-helicase domain-containing protein [Candidatus Doudnabacteria bacterium]